MRGSITQLAGQMCQTVGRNHAAEKIWSRYCRQLLVLARKHLALPIRQREDEEDILQNAYCSFCRRLEIGEFELNSRAEIWNLLAKITIGKARKAAEKHRREKRDVRRERSAIGNGMDSLSSGGLLRQLMSDEPSPDCVAEFADSLKRIIQCLPSPSTRLLLLYKLEGYTNAEVADRLGCTPRTVERKLATIRAAAQGIL